MSLKKYTFIVISFFIICTSYFINANEPTPRSSLIQQLKNETYDILIIGGGATGAGAALDAANRGYKVALIERFDFGSGTSSKSTKLIHGGVRYLEKAVFNLDLQQYQLVKEALHERSHLLKIAPHLVKSLEIITPIYHWWEIPYYWMGLKLYDWVAGDSNLRQSEYIPPSTLIEKIPNIHREGLWGGIAYSDGQFNDARFNISLVLSASALNVPTVNYAEVLGLIHHPESGSLIGARVHDSIEQNQFDVYAKVIINATGPYVDAVRIMDNPNAEPIIAASSGTHLLLDRDIIASESGLLIPKTADGRVIFMLPWEGGTLVGTTDNPTELTDQPFPHEDDVAYLRSYVTKYLNIDLPSTSIKSVWTGIRPLVQTKKSEHTSNIVREHYIEHSPSGLLTITGGKWTTYRKMAEEIVNEAALKLENRVVPANQLDRLVGAEKYTPSLSSELQLRFGIDADIAEHLTSSYGGIALDLLLEGEDHGLNRRLIDHHPIILAEIQWALTKEMAQKPMDILARRTRLATLDAQAAKIVLPKVTRMMQDHFGWSDDKAAKIQDEAERQLEKMLPSL